MTKVLIVEDQFAVAEKLASYLRKANFEIIVLNSGDRVVDIVKNEHPDLITLDVMLPEKDGVTCCKEIRAFSDIPIIMVTGKVEDIDRIIGLEAGADDYICKPFNGKELILRINAVLKRSLKQLEENLSIFRLKREELSIIYNDQSVKLTRLEFALFNLLSSKPGRIYSRSQIIDLAYVDEKEISERAVDSHVKNLRKKIKDLGVDKEVIRSVYGTGFQYIHPDF